MTLAVDMAPRLDVSEADGLMDNGLRTRLVDRIVRDDGLDTDLANRIMDETLKFLVLVANDDREFAPSPMVDIGWHAFILHTREYASFCNAIAGRFIHHAPAEGGDAHVGETFGVARTVQALRDRGFNIADDIWMASADCGGHKCYSGDCSNTR